MSKKYPKKRRTIKTIRKNTRNWDDPAYVEWKRKVKTRDGKRCQWTDCKCKNGLQVHHILRWSDYPFLRFVVDNGITLCRKHHKFIQNKEDDYIAYFVAILAAQKQGKIK